MDNDCLKMKYQFNHFVWFLFQCAICLVDAGLTQYATNVSTCVGNNVTLDWKYSNNGIFQVNWSKNFTNFLVQFPPNSIIKVALWDLNVKHIDNGEILLINPSTTDSGIYSIHLLYEPATIEGLLGSAIVTIKEPPSLPVYTVDVSGAQTTYKCNTSSLGTPHARVTIKIGETDIHSANATVDFDDPVYCCVVGDAVECMKNKNQQNQQNTYCINIITPTGPDHMHLSPNTTIYTRNMGETLGPVMCSANCTPDCTYNWIKESSVVSENATLFIIINTKNDSGNYTCIATRGVSRTDTKNVALHVRYGPEDISFHPAGLTYTDTENNQLSIKCLSDCYPACTYNWIDERNNQTISTTETLYFNPLKREKHGRYKCTVTNEIDGVANPINKIITVNVRYGPDPVSFDPTGSSYMGNETETLKIACLSSCFPGCSYTWKKGGTVVPSVGGVLNFSNLNRSHAGTYTCTAKNNYSGISDSETGSVIVKVNYGPDSALLSPLTTVYTVNASTKLHDINCTSECSPMCSHIWIKHGTSSGVVAENGLLQLGVLTKEHAGNYVCTASNSELSKSKTAEVKIYIRYGPDEISITPAGPTYSIQEGYPVSDFSCSSICYPGCSQIWNSVTTDVDLASGNVLSLGVANRTFTGNYTCTSTNDANEFRKKLVQSVFITVEYHPDVTVSQINGTDITEGSQNIMLICSAKGDPKNYNFTEWIHYAQDGFTQIRTLEPSLGDHDKAYLKFPTTSYMDSGIYKCSVTNGIPNFASLDMFAHANATQVVKGRPVITEWKKDVVSNSNKNFSLFVTYYSNDGSTPKVKWYRTENDTIQERHALEDNMFFENNEEYVTVDFYTENVLLPGYKTELFIQNVGQSDFGDYNVSVSNTVGATVLTIHLNAKGAPDPPIMFSIVKGSVTSTSVMLTWICGFHNGADQTFIIQHNTSLSPWQTKAYVDGGQLEYTRFNATIDQLSAKTQYFFRIFAANKYGNSSVSEKILTATTDAVEEAQTNSSNVGLIAGGAAGGVVLAAIIVVLVLFFLRRRKDYLKSPSKRLLKDNKRTTGTNGTDDSPEINLNPMYESAGTLPSSSINNDVYSQVDKNRKKAKLVGDIYSQVDKPKNRQTSDRFEVKNDVYAQVQKQTQKERDTGKTKHKKQKPDKKTKQRKQAEGDIYDNVDTINSTATKKDTEYENPSCSIEDEHPKQISNPGELIYADLDLPKEIIGKGRKAVIHGLDDRTDYADIKYGEVGEQAPESDEESRKQD